VWPWHAWEFWKGNVKIYAKSSPKPFVFWSEWYKLLDQWMCLTHSKEREKGYPHPTVTVKRLWAFIRKGKQRVCVRQINISVLKTCTKHKACLKWNNISASADLTPWKGCLYKGFNKEIPTDWQTQFDLSGCCVWYDISYTWFSLFWSLYQKRGNLTHTHSQRTEKRERKKKKSSSLRSSFPFVSYHFLCRLWHQANDPTILCKRTICN
jgi:hypothetical protein